MGIGALGAVGTYQPYIYNTNTINRNSLNAIDKVDNNVSKSHIEKKVSPYAEETVNPLALGETENFEDILNSQMQMAKNNADRIFGDDSVFA